MGSFVAAACQVRAGTDPRETVVMAARSGAKLVVLPAWCLPAAHPDAGDAVLREMAADIAREAGCHLVAGTSLVDAPEGTARFQVARLFSPRGKLVGEQAQTHTTRDEEAAGLRCGPTLQVFSALGVGIGLVVGTDAWVPEVSRILTLEGATILVAPTALPAPYHEDRHIAGLWREVQQNQVFGIEACLVGEWGGRVYAGRSAVTVACEAVSDASGFVVRAPSADTALTVLAAIDLEARERGVAGFDILAQLNTALYRKYFPMTYFRRPSGRTVRGEGGAADGRTPAQP